MAGGIGPASSDLVERTISDAADADAQLLVIELDTPGGLDKSMRSLIKQIIASPIPVISYVSPQGARAASAGTYILYASHIAAMAPATNLGAATPVQIGGPSAPRSPYPRSQDDQQPDDNATALRRKVVNDAVAYIRGLAELRGRNADWAEAAVREAASIDAAEALKLEVIDLVAVDIDDLLRQLDGRVVQVQNRDYPLRTQGMQLQLIEPDWRHQFLLVITNPNVAYILMMLGVYGLLLEFYHPGIGLPGIVGGICLLLALYALQLLPISYTGLALIALGIGLMVVEALSPSFGLFGLGGAIAFVIGSVLLMDTQLPAYQIALPVIAAFTLMTLVLAILALALALKARRSAVVSGVSTMLGQQATALVSFEGDGKVSIQGETWNAHSVEAIKRGDSVTITAIDGLILEVKKGDR
ncbi:NfeD family protein [Motiliproteus coralliicola]|uniref:NfeD family protein n=1 Tax=Motiliproteus coralliicola TaxID=2283196 RepID=UPI001FB2A46F|nr:nodulation protein NfeD [Motiliproteus coralliicola]